MSPADEVLFVTGTPPTPNGDLHLGHFSGPYLAADVFARHQRRRGEVVLATGIDDHQSYTDLRARQDGRTAADVADDFGDRIERSWRRLHVSWDVVSRPRRSRHHRRLVERFVTVLAERGQLVARTRPLPWCPGCRAWAYEAYVRGTCPHCASPSGGNACEVCCRPNDCADLGDPHCTRCGSATEPRPCERLYFPLAPHRDRLARFWAEAGMNPHLVAVCERMAEPGLPEIAVSHPGPWGIPTPPLPGLPDLPGHTLYVWFEMAAGYLATAAEAADSVGAGDRGGRHGLWGAGPVVQFFGVDNGYFHAVLFPALMTAYDPAIALPAAFVCNEFYRLDGEKFSTSRKHAVWIDQALVEAPADHLRLFLCLDRPAATQTNFTWERLRTRLDEDLLVRWSAWLAAAQRRFDRVRDTGPGPDRDTGPEPVVGTLLAAVDEAYSLPGFSPRRAVELCDVLATEGAELGAGSDHLADAPTGRDRLAAAAGREAYMLAAFAAGLAPVAPTMAEQLWSALALPGTAAGIHWADVPGLRPPWWEVADLPGECPLFAVPVRSR